MSINPPTQYATDRNLAARQRLWTTCRREPAFDLMPWVIDLAGISPGGTQRVLDVGCGNGAYEAVLRARRHRGLRVALDLSAGMLAQVEDAARLQADVERLPLAAGAFDVVLAPHMLYHVPDIPSALREVRRVLRPGGVFVAVTNGVANLAELRDLIERAVGNGYQMRRPADTQFSLEEGDAVLRQAFGSVTRVDCPRCDLVVDDVDALADYVASIADFYEAHAGRPWAEVVERVRDLGAGIVAREGEIRFSTAVGAFVCR